jgi:UDP-N-acetylmuramate--alanine ligase
MKDKGVDGKTHVHFVGIGGSGLSAIARMLQESGYEVTGSDRALSPFAADLQAAGVKVYVGHDAHNIEGADWVVRSSAVPDDNAEVLAAQAAGIPVYRRADFLGRFMENKTGIAVAGTHGKTTTTAMIAFILTELGLSPSFIVGGFLSNLDVNAKAGGGEFIVIEADEYDRMFLGLKPRIEVITSVEYDHPDCYPTMDAMVEAFESFVALLPFKGTLVACLDNAGSAALIHKARSLDRPVVAYTMQQEATIIAPRWLQARNVRKNERGGFDFEAWTNIAPAEHVEVSLQVPGRHNVGNALAALSVMAVLKLSLRNAAEALSKFSGTSRRFEVKGERDGILVIDDYAHHPTEIRATLAAARARYPERRLWAVWQPHTYSRTQALFREFVEAFEDADEVIVTEVYAAREPKQDFSAEQVVRRMGRTSARFIPALEDVTTYLLEHLRKDDVLLVLSAGDADQVSADVLAGTKR